MSHLKISKRRTGKVVILDIEGRITLGATSATLRDAVDAVLDGGGTKVLANLMGVSYIDSSGLGELVSALAKAERHGATFKLVNLSARVQGLFRVTKLITVFETFERERDAVRSFAPAGVAPDVD
jgi:anti-sigma B factor antagonist